MAEQDRQKDLLNRLTFVAFDTETTGLWAPSNRIVEIGAVRFRLDDDRSESFQSLVNPERPIPEDVIPIHGITDDMVAEADPIKPVLERFFEFCGSDSVLIAHNAPFDISFIYFEMDRCALKAVTGPILDTVDIYRRFFPGLPGYSLESLSRHFGITDTQQHRALADAELVHGLFRHAIKNIPPVDDMATLRDTLTVHDISTWEAMADQVPAGFEPLRDAARQNGRVEMNYGTPGTDPSSRVVQPRQFYALGSQFYMQAFCERANAERTFRLDRITEFKVLE
jgi:DNA polymerase III epsilon subunit family exonuclease